MNRRSHSHSTAPAWLWIPAAIGIAFLLVPIIGMISRIEPGTLSEVVLAPESRIAMGLSLLTSVVSAIVSVAIGFPLGYLLATKTFPGQRIVRTLILLPLVLPPVVSGLALLYTWGRSAYLGSLLTDAGLGLAYTTAAVVVAQIFVSLPFMVMSVETAVAARGTGYELAAAELGATPGRVFFTVTLPLLRPGIMTGAVLCFARSLGEFGATLTFAGSLEGVTRTMPLQIYLVRESDPQSAIALSLLLVLVALIIIVLAYRSPHAPKLRPSRPSGDDADGAVAPAGVQPRSAYPTLSTAANDSSASAPDADESAAGTGGPPRREFPPSHPAIELQATLDERDVELNFSVPSAATTAVIGRNGAGKSTLFHVTTGALAADSGSLRIGDEVIFDIEAGTWPAIHDRGIVHLAQNPLLFPHLSVIDNVAYGLRCQGLSRQDARRRGQVMLDRLGVGHTSGRRPSAVSGGQAARIALARALLIEPRLLLLDEPLAALDVDVKVETRKVLREVLEGRSALLVTHDVDDVIALASSLVLIDSGRTDYVAEVGEIDTAAPERGRDFLRSFCETDREGILCSRSQ
ncbi:MULTISPECIES: ABC transporter permease [unclassified Brevibacterium]|uniref:ABC transporter permease n=1 Tax=unclassified Brevibacterium TaxID=2614124 RepID=UPI001E470BD3|nr:MULTISPECIES: ABC transporter permease [unclassified Brevibacterium]MCD1284751.1 molybdate ABC transporter permease subunit [Brevibacterium sp. CCUG 69071]MDK8435628.1 ABC transporter permease [Brevibacterium sp. H-BE7]